MEHTRVGEMVSISFFVEINDMVHATYVEVSVPTTSGSKIGNDPQRVRSLPTDYDGTRIMELCWSLRPSAVMLRNTLRELLGDHI